MLKFWLIGDMSSSLCLLQNCVSLCYNKRLSAVAHAIWNG